MKPSPRGARGRNARGEASVQRILDSTVQLVSRYGYDNTTIARITTATQRPASSIYWYFEDKDDLIATALESSYSSTGGRRRPWQSFDASAPLLTQLINELEPELRASESEAPLRLGIMLSLEGSAAQSKIQEPFQKRRASALKRIEQWWDAAFSVTGTAAEQRRLGIWWMSTLTLAIFDGHYISDVPGDDDAAQRSRFVAHVLARSFDVVHSGALPEPAPTGEHTSSKDGSAVDTEPPGLLHVTRDLVAQHGYEGATIGRICTMAGMQRSSVYWRYKDKDTLIKAAVAEPFVSLFSPFDRLPRSTEGWSGNLAAAMTEVMREAQAEPDAVKAGLLLKVQQWDPPTSGGSAIAEGAAATEAALVAWLTAVVSGCDETAGRHFAWTVMRLTEGLLFGSVSGRPVPVDTMNRLLSSVFDGALDR